MPRSRGVAAAALVLLIGGGCRNGVLPDPNDPNDVGVLQPDVLRRDLKYASDSLNARVLSGDISQGQFQTLMSQYADKLVSHLRIERVPPRDAWKYGEAFRTAKRWKEAEKFYRIAVKAAPNMDRFVNDSLHLAQAMAHNGEVAAAIPIVRATYVQSKPTDKAPILLGTLLEFVPAARGQGHDLELADLLEGAIAQEEQTVVDPKTDSGSAFLMTKHKHIADAWETVIELYNGAGRPQMADEAEKRAEKDLGSPGSF